MEKFRNVPNWSYQAAGRIIRGHNKRRQLYFQELNSEQATILTHSEPKPHFDKNLTDLIRLLQH